MWCISIEQVFYDNYAVAYWQVPVYPMLHTSPPATLPKPKPKPPVAPADDIQLPPVGYNRKTPPNGYWTPPPKYEDIFARRSNPPPSPPRDQVNQSSLVTSLHFLISLLPFSPDLCIGSWTSANIWGANKDLCLIIHYAWITLGWFLSQKYTTFWFCMAVEAKKVKKKAENFFRFDNHSPL